MTNEFNQIIGLNKFIFFCDLLLHRWGENGSFIYTVQFKESKKFFIHLSSVQSHMRTNNELTCKNQRHIQKDTFTLSLGNKICSVSNLSTEPTNKVFCSSPSKSE